MKRANRRRLIKQIQALYILLRCNATGRLVANGKWDLFSNMATIHFQQAHGLKQTGRLDAETLNYMRTVGARCHLPEQPTDKDIQAALILCGYEKVVANGRNTKVTIAALRSDFIRSFEPTEEDEGPANMWVNADLLVEALGQQATTSEG